MDQRILGRTGLRVSVLGLGGGGYSRLGVQKGDDNAVGVVRRALELGVNIIDTAEVYGTELHVGKAIKGIPRESLVLCTKTLPGSLSEPRDLKSLSLSLENSLHALGTDYIDIYQLHGVTADVYPDVLQRVVPELFKFRQQGKIRFIGITERFETDTRHEMHQLSSRDPDWDTLMVGFNILNTSARQTIFPDSRKHNAGILNMFAVRHALINQENLKPVLKKLIEQGQVPSDEINLDKPLEFLFDEVESLTEAAYRYCLRDPDIHVVLCGTGSIAHLEQNVQAILKGPLSQEACDHLDKIFGTIDSESGRRSSKT